MLQIMTGRFYDSNEDDNVYITTHRAVLYTNYRIFRESISTKFGELKEAANMEEIKTIIYEGSERLPRNDKSPHTGEIKPAFLVSVGSDSIVNDFSFLASFILKSSFSTDRDLIYRITKSSRPSSGVLRPMKNYVSGYFDEEVIYKSEDEVLFNSFVDNLLNLPRYKFEAVMRSIRRFITGIHRMGDDLDLSYTLLVASIESLAQNFDEFEPTWESMEVSKRGSLDKSLKKIEDSLAEEIRSKLLRHEHLSLSRRFREFALANISPSYFRSEAIGITTPVSEIEIEAALKSAYSLRSKYVHELQELPRAMKFAPYPGEIWHLENKPILSFEGLARLSRSIIINYVNSAEKIPSEDYIWNTSLPNTITAQLAAEYWIWDDEGYNTKSSVRYFNGLLEIITDMMLNQRKEYINLFKVCEKIESLVPNVNEENKVKMVITYWLYNLFLRPDSRLPNHDIFIGKYEEYIDKPSIFTLIGNVIQGYQSDWELEQNSEIWKSYINQRNSSSGLRATQLIETAICLRTAEIFRLASDIDECNKWLNESMRCYPGNSKIIDIEHQIKSDPAIKIDWQEILLPKKDDAEKNVDQDQP